MDQRPGAAGGGWGRPEAARHVQRGSVMLGGGRRLLVMPGFGSQYLEAAGGGWRRPVAAFHDWRQPEAARNARQKYVFPKDFRDSQWNVMF